MFQRNFSRKLSPPIQDLVNQLENETEINWSIRRKFDLETLISVHETEIERHIVELGRTAVRISDLTDPLVMEIEVGNMRKVVDFAILNLGNAIKDLLRQSLNVGVVF